MAGGGGLTGGAGAMAESISMVYGRGGRMRRMWNGGMRRRIEDDNYGPMTTCRAVYSRGGDEEEDQK